jgi:hypothetical protein
MQVGLMHAFRPGDLNPPHIRAFEGVLKMPLLPFFEESLLTALCDPERGTRYTTCIARMPPCAIVARDRANV